MDITPEQRQQVEEQIRSREEVRRQNPELFAEINRMIFEADPIGINFEDNTDEYEPEVGTIIPRLPSCVSAACVRRVVHEEFERWFGADIAGPEARYTALSEGIWVAWQRHRQ
jgi:hypothetical protein